jgi:hypothetical protein
MKLITYLTIFTAILFISTSFASDDSDDSAEIELSSSENDQDQDALIDKREALNFFKRTFFHPGKTKNEEIKRETREVYEEKCRNIVPFASR